MTTVPGSTNASFLIHYIYPSCGLLLGSVASLLVLSLIHQTHEGITTIKKLQFCTGFIRTLPKKTTTE